MSTKTLNDQNVPQFARVLIRMHGHRAPYFAAIHALARQESGETEDSRLWLAVERVTSHILSLGSEKAVH